MSVSALEEALAFVNAKPLSAQAQADDADTRGGGPGGGPGDGGGAGGGGSTAISASHAASMNAVNASVCITSRRSRCSVVDRYFLVVVKGDRVRTRHTIHTREQVRKEKEVEMRVFDR